MANVKGSTSSAAARDDDQMLVQLRKCDLRELIADAVADAMADALSDLKRNREPDLLSGKEMAAKIGVSRTKLYVLRNEGCPSVKVGDTYKFEPAAVLRWLKERGTR
jgi:hypothetical protein